MELYQREEGRILSQENLGEDIFSMWIEVKRAKEAKPGQFVSLYTKDKSKLLPRPISICEVDKKRQALRLVYRVTGEKTGTKEFSMQKAQERISLIGPLGNGFLLQKKKALFFGGGIGIPPMLQLMKEWPGEKRMVAGYRDQFTFLAEEFAKEGPLYIATEDGSVGTKGNVIDGVKEQMVDYHPEVICACGPIPMLKAIKEYALEKGIPCYVSLEEKMACGIGACLACVCNTTQVDDHSLVKNKRICKDGPVFLATEVDFS